MELTLGTQALVATIFGVNSTTLKLALQSTILESSL